MSFQGSLAHFPHGLRRTSLEKRCEFWKEEIRNFERVSRLDDQRHEQNGEQFGRQSRLLIFAKVSHQAESRTTDSRAKDSYEATVE